MKATIHFDLTVMEPDVALGTIEGYLQRMPLTERERFEALSAVHAIRVAIAPKAAEVEQ